MTVCVVVPVTAGVPLLFWLAYTGTAEGPLLYTPMELETTFGSDYSGVLGFRASMKDKMESRAVASASSRLVTPMLKSI